MVENLSHWIIHYKYFGIYFLQAAGILGLPIPDDSTLLFMGYFIHRHRLEWAPTVLAAFLGSASGITVSYLLGHTFGLFLLHRYGSKIGLTEEKLEKVHTWFRRTGKWALVFGFFLPGIRHLNGYVSGSSKLEFSVFAAYAYPGAFVWVLVFILAGNWLGKGWTSLAARLRPIPLAILATGVLALAGYLLLHFKLLRKKNRK